MIDRFPEAFLDELRAVVTITDVVGQHVTWDKSKSNPGRDDLWACCPFHNEKSPSFHAEGQDGRYHCFGCGASGDHFQFLMALNGTDFPAAVAEIASMAGIDLPEGTGSSKPSRPPEQPRQTKMAPQPSAGEIRPEIVKTYDYTDRDGSLLYQVCRLQKKLPDGTWAKNKDGKGTWKTFLQRRPDGAGKWIWSLSSGEFMRKPGGDWRVYDGKKFAEGMETRFFDAGAEHTIYRHPDVEIAIAEAKTILITEGEKDAETAVALGFCGTTNSSGSKHWKDYHSACFRGADVVICLDNDAAGDRADDLAKSMKGIARRIRVIDFAQYVPGFGHGNDITDWVEKFGGTSDQLEKFIEGLPDYRPRLPPSRFGAQTMKQIASKPVVYDWLIKNLIEREGILVVAGETGAAKTFFNVDMGMKIARGLEYGGRKVKQGLVVYIASEDGKGVKLRVEGYRVENQISPDLDVPFVVLDPQAEGAELFSLMSDESVEKMIAECLALEEHYGMKLEMIFVDTISAAAEGLDENSSSEATKMLARANRLRVATKATVCLAHHMNAGATKMRGSTAIPANVPNIIELRPVMTAPSRRDEKPIPVLDSEGRPLRRAVLTKNKNGLADVKWTFCLKVVPIGFDEEGEERTTCVCVRPSRNSGSAGAEDQPTKLIGDQKLVFDALVIAQADSTVSGEGSGGKAVAHADFVAAVRKRMSFNSEKPEDQQKELAAFLKRTTTALMNAGYMGRDNDKKIVWWTGKSDRPRPPRREPDPPPPPDPIPEDIRQDLGSDPVPF